MVKRRRCSFWILFFVALVAGLWLLTSMMAALSDTPYVSETVRRDNDITRNELSRKEVEGGGAGAGGGSLFFLADVRHLPPLPPADTRNNSWEDVAPQLNQTAVLHNMRDNMTMKDYNASHVSDILELIALNKEGRVVNPHPFKYISNGENLCKDKNVYLLVYVHTAPAHFKHRSIIRQTWGNALYYPGTDVRVVFVMGVDEKGDTQPAVAFESAQYGDIVQEDFRDTYRNLTYKGIAALKWISTYCPHATFILKTDDDIFVNMFTLLRHLRSLAELSNVHKRMLLCLVWDRMPVLREGKWGISEKEFKANYYPVYCSGSAFVMTTDVAVALHEASYAVPFFWVDDFYVTGLLTMRVPDLDRRQFISTYVLDGQKLEEKFNGPQWYLHIFSHLRFFSSYVHVWNRLVQLANGVGAVKIEYKLPSNIG